VRQPDVGERAPAVPDAQVQERRTVSLEELEREAARVWRELPPGAVVWLSGELGSGKTTFVQAVARAAGGQPARSPTFSLIHEYASPEGPLVHVDCYRLRDPAEAIDLDFPGLERDARLLLVEWPERAGLYASPPDLHIRLAHADDPLERILERWQ
jgi:tRNA threonylcarbamoyladenosine biosynthesis protein TsaE